MSIPPTSPIARAAASIRHALPPTHLDVLADYFNAIDGPRDPNPLEWLPSTSPAFRRLFASCGSVAAGRVAQDAAASEARSELAQEPGNRTARKTLMDVLVLRAGSLYLLDSDYLEALRAADAQRKTKHWSLPQFTERLPARTTRKLASEILQLDSAQYRSLLAQGADRIGTHVAVSALKKRRDRAPPLDPIVVPAAHMENRLLGNAIQEFCRLTGMPIPQWLNTGRWVFD